MDQTTEIGTSEDNSSNADNFRSFTEPVIVGVSSILLTVSFFAPYLYAIGWMSSDRNLHRKSFQRIMIALGAVDLVQLSVNGFVGSALVIGRRTPPFWVNKALGAVLNTSFIVHSSLATLLAFNRFVVMCLSQEWRHKIFTRFRTDCVIIGCFAYGAVFLLAYLCPGVDVKLYVDIYSWHYSDTPVSNTFCMIELIQDFSQIVLMIVFYAAVVTKMKMLVNNMSTAINGQRATTNREIGISVQAGLISVVVTVGLVIWFAAPQVAANRWSYLAANTLWLATAGTNAWIYFIFNKPLRCHAKYFLCCFVKKNGLMDREESAYSSSFHSSQRQKRMLALMGYGAACIARPVNPNAELARNRQTTECTGN